MADAPDIVVSGYSDRYVAAVATVLVREGGFVDDPKDRGGATNFGISLRFLVAEGAIDLDGDGVADFDLDMDGDIDGRDIRQLTRGDAVWLYHRCFWQRLPADRFVKPIGEAMFDQGVNGGLVASRKLLQTAVNAGLQLGRLNLPRLNVDGVLGDMTMGAYESVLAAIGVKELLDEYRAAAATRYRAIVSRNPSQSRFLNGWLRRAAHLGEP